MPHSFLADLILCQAIVRRKLATNQKSKLVQAKEVTCAIRIQAIWRGFVANNKFIHAIADIILVQSIVRRYRAIRIVVQWREQRSILVAAVTRLSATWRRFYVEREYKYNLAGEKIIFVCMSSEKTFLTSITYLFLFIHNRYHSCSISCTNAQFVSRSQKIKGRA